MRLKGKIALVTGGGAGIGKATAALFAREGACVTIAELDAETGAAAAKQIIEEGGRAIFVRTDVSSPEAVEAAVQRTVSEFGGLDMLYNNVGGSSTRDGTVVTSPIEVFRRQIEVDLLGPWLGAKYAVPEMIKRGGGSIIHATSICALRAMANRAAYTAAKGGITALTHQMAGDLAITQHPRQCGRAGLRAHRAHPGAPQDAQGQPETARSPHPRPARPDRYCLCGAVFRGRRIAPHDGAGARRRQRLHHYLTRAQPASPRTSRRLRPTLRARSRADTEAVTDVAVLSVVNIDARRVHCSHAPLHRGGRRYAVVLADDRRTSAGLSARNRSGRCRP